MPHPNNYFTLQRTLRVPDAEGKSYTLPPGLGAFPIIACKDTAAPLAWANDYMFPMHRSEAMWVSFHSTSNHPHAIVMTASGVNVVTGDVITDINQIKLVAEPQNYMVARPQPWIDGIKHADGKVRQFVAVTFESGKSLGQQVAGIKDDTIKMSFYPPKDPSKYERPRSFMRSFHSFDGGGTTTKSASISACSMSMGMGAGGEIDQKIYPDPHGIEEWNLEAPIQFNLRIVNAEMWEALTGQKVPHAPPGPDHYAHYGYPWFKLYEEHKSDLKPSQVLAAVKSAYDGTEKHITYAPPVPLKAAE